MRCPMPALSPPRSLHERRRQAKFDNANGGFQERSGRVRWVWASNTLCARHKQQQCCQQQPALSLHPPFPALPTALPPQTPPHAQRPETLPSAHLPRTPASFLLSGAQSRSVPARSALPPGAVWHWIWGQTATIRRIKRSVEGEPEDLTTWFDHLRARSSLEEDRKSRGLQRGPLLRSAAPVSHRFSLSLSTNLSFLLSPRLLLLPLRATEAPLAPPIWEENQCCVGQVLTSQELASGLQQHSTHIVCPALSG